MTTLKRNLTKAVGGILLGVVLLTALAACGGSSAGALSLPATPAATATRTATPASVRVDRTTPVPTPTQSTVSPSIPVTTPAVINSNSDLLAQGKLIFEKTAGGVGCAACHGLDGKGLTQMNSPNIRGKNEGNVRIAIQGGVPMMTFIKLSDEEITAVVTYLKYLNE